MQQTQYYGFLKPETTDDITPDPFNSNADAMDIALHNLSTGKQETLSTSQMNSVNSGMTTAKRQKLDALPTASELNTSFNGKQNTLTTEQMNAVNSGITSAKVSKLDALPTSTQLENSIDTSWHASDHIYEGRDLTVVFASEIANYSDEWAWIQARLNNHNLRGIHVADYIPIKIAEGGGDPAQVHWAEIAGINTYRRTGDEGNEVGYHIDWITRECYSRQVKWNTENNNNGNSSNAQPFLASNLKNWLDTVVYPRLETKLKNVIKPKRVLAPTRYQSGTTLTDDNSWAWSSFDRLWVPFESEVFDTHAWSTKGLGYGQAVQYPIFANSYEHRIKGRLGWWLASASSGGATDAVYVSGDGVPHIRHASLELFVPLCFRTMEDAP